MRVGIIAILTICTAGAAELIHVMKESAPPTDVAERLTVSVESGEVLVHNSDERHIVQAQFQFSALARRALFLYSSPRAATPTAVVAPTPTPTPTPKIVDALPSSMLHVRIVDALGDYIPNATLEIDGNIHDAPGGQLSVEGLPDGEYTLTAHAAGYETVERTVTLPAPELLDIPLEYLCSFWIEVHAERESASPVAGATVELYEGIEILRPVRDSVTVCVPDFSEVRRRCDVVLRRGPDGVRVVRANRFGGSTFQDREFDGIGQSNPMVGDRLAGLSGAMWEAGEVTRDPYYGGSLYGDPINSRLRIWDSLTALCQSSESTKYVGFLELDRDGRYFRPDFFGVDLSRRGRLIATVTTDENGRCAFEDLPARFYVAIAYNGDRISWPSVIPPSKRRKRLCVWPESGPGLSVSTTIAGIDDYRHAAIQRARVQVKGLDQNVIMTSETDGLGDVHFAPVPPGRYRITITPPAIAGVGEPKVVELDMSRPSKRVVVKFDLDPGYRISGRVLRADTGEPVDDFLMKLETKHALYGYASDWSENGGRFEFINVAPGEYTIVEHLTRFSYHGFIPAYRGFRQPDAPVPPKPSKLTVADEDITGLEFLVLPGVRTRFSGTVVDPDGQPVEGVDVSLNRGVVESDGQTGPDGRFDLSVFLAQCEAEVEAVLGGAAMDQPEPKTLRTGEFTSFGSFRSPSQVAHGECPVTFHVGDTVDDVRLVLRQEEEGAVVRGRITTVDGDLTEQQMFFMNIYAYQGRQVRLSDKEPDGWYRIENVQAGEITVYCDPNNPSKMPSQTQGTPKPGISYMSQMHQLEMPEGQPELAFDITLERATHFYGKVIDADHNPVNEVYVKAMGPGWESYGLSETDREGVFLVDGLQPGVVHMLVASTEISDGTLAVIEDLMPPDENVTIMVTMPE